MQSVTNAPWCTGVHSRWLLCLLIIAPYCPVAHGRSTLSNGVDMGEEETRIVTPKIIWPSSDVYYDSGPTRPLAPNSSPPVGAKLPSAFSQGPPLDMQYKLSREDVQTNHQKALLAAKAARAAADELLLVAARTEQQRIADVANKMHENELDAMQRFEKAIQKARDHADMLPGHNFANLDPLQQDDKSRSIQLIGEQHMLENHEEELILRMCGFNCSGHGSCNTNIGCQCSQGWTGKFCDSLACPGNCNNKGMCIGGKCICSAPFYGDGCQQTRCKNDCSGHGYCFQGRCQCSGDYGGESCMILVHSSSTSSFESKSSELLVKNAIVAEAPAFISGASKSCASNCNGHGTCWNGKCNCNDGWSGPSCQHSCPNSCSGNGKCNSGVCTCAPGYSSLDCSLKSGSLLSFCHDASCSGHGTCNKRTNACECNPGYHGSRCQSRCPHSCNGRGTCVDGACVCWPQWGGPACNASNEIPVLLAEAPLLGNDASNGNNTSSLSALNSGAEKSLVSPMTASWLSPSTQRVASSQHVGTALLSTGNKTKLRGKPGLTLKSLLKTVSGSAGKRPLQLSQQQQQKPQRHLEHPKLPLKQPEPQQDLEQPKQTAAPSTLLDLFSSWIH